MILIQDSREQTPLTFPKVTGVELKVEAMTVGDYTALHTDRQHPEIRVLDTSVIERKSVGDLFHSFTSNYEAEREKIHRAQALHLTYILAIESTFSDILHGHAYWKDGTRHQMNKSGLAMIRQLMTIQRKYGIQVWYCQTRHIMALMILEYFLAAERVKPDEVLNGQLSTPTHAHEV